MFVGDDGLTGSRYCRQDRVEQSVRSAACEAGADAVQVVNHREPSIWDSSRHQIRARLLDCGEAATAEHD